MDRRDNVDRCDEADRRGETGTIPAAELAALSGLDALQAMIDGRIARPPMAVTLDFELVEVAKGRAVFRGRPRAGFNNPMGTVHGGWAATLLDSALACAVHSTLAAGEAYTTLEFKVNLVQPITADSGVLRCEGVIVHRGGRIATSEATLKDADGRLFAHGSETCLILAGDRPAAAGAPSR